MKVLRHLKYVIGCGLILFLAGWLFLGIYRDREFGDKYLFVKHMPTFKFNFYAPLGESDVRLDKLDRERRSEEMLYQEFVEKRAGSHRSIPLP